VGEALKNVRGEVLGHVDEGENVAHVVVRTTTSIPGVIENYRKTEVISFERDGAAWKGLLSGDMELQIGQMLQKLTAGRAEPSAAPEREKSTPGRKKR
jgi:hypothetical protein